MTTTDIIQAYPYVQFADDDNISAWFDAFNEYAQVYLDWFNNTPLAVYTNDNISGDLLDWVAAGIYGCYRTPIAFGNSRTIGALNTYTPNYLPLNQGKDLSNQTSFTMTDDIFKRVITWNFYKADGTQMSIPWLKKRIARFAVVALSDVSITVSGRSVTIKISNADSKIISYLQSIIQLGLVNLPFSFSYVVESA